MEVYVLLLLFLYSFVPDVESSCRLKEQIALNLPKSRSQCFRLLNGTHQVGCQTKKTGNIGTVIVYQENFESIVQTFENNDEPMIVLLPYSALNKKTTRLLHSSPIIEGVILHGDIASFSEDAVCPAFEFSLYSNRSTCRRWNDEYSLHEHGFKFLDWDKPIFTIEDADALSVLTTECFEKFNQYLAVPSSFSQTGLRCRVKMSMFMHAAGNADMCLRRQNLYNGFTEKLDMCDVLSSNNIHYSVPALHAEDKVNVFLLNTRLDTFSVFSSSIGGDNSVLSSLIPILLIAKALGSSRELFEKKSKETNRQLMFSFFEGESLGFIGSSRMAYDMLNHEFPRKPKSFGKSKTGATINITNISFMAELNHIGSARSDLYFHIDGPNYAKNKDKIDPVTSNIVKVLSQFGVKGHYAENSVSSQLPPSSYQNFLRHDRTIPGFVLSADRDKYALDSIDSINDAHITHDNGSREGLAAYYNSVSKAVFSAVTNFVYNDPASATRDYTFDEKFAQQLIDCLFLEKWNCEYLKTIVPNYEERYHSIRNFYIGTSGQESPILNIVEAVLVQALGDTHATTNVKTGEQCETLNPGQSVYSYVWAHNEAAQRDWCYRTSMFVTKARSPAFDEGYLNLGLSNYSTWVEAVWDAYKLEVYLEGSHYVTPHLAFSIGIIAFAVFLTTLNWTMVNGQGTQRIVENGRNTTVRYQSVPTRSEEIAFENDLV